VAVAGSQADVGCTTLALNLAVAAGCAGRPVLLLEGDLRGGSLARHCGLQPRGTLTDVLTARKLFEEVVLSGPAGIQLVPSGADTEVALPAARTLPEQLPALRRFADLLLVDLGTLVEPLASLLVPYARPLLLVTTPDTGSVMDAYTLMKWLAGREVDVPLRLLVNRAAESREAEEVHGRLDRSCRRFLQRSLEYAGYVPADPAVVEASGRGSPVLTEFADRPAGRAIAALAERLALAATAGPEQGRVPGKRPGGGSGCEGEHDGGKHDEGKPQRTRTETPVRDVTLDAGTD
jgi:flagellar biosynthesis protein FlhG